MFFPTLLPLHTLLWRLTATTTLVLVLFLAPLSTAIAAPATIAVEDFDARVMEVLRRHPEVILESVQAYQQRMQDESQRAQATLLMDMGAHPAQYVGRSPSKGSAVAPVTLIEFADFQCPFCSKAAGVVREFAAKHLNDVRLVYKHFPLDFHEQSKPAASAAWAAGEQGKFWQFHDALYAKQNQLGEALYLATAKDLGLDLARFNRDRTSVAASEAIEQDMKLAVDVGLQGTPLFVMNGIPMFGVATIEQFETALTEVRSLS